MFKFGPSSLSKLGTCEPRLQQVILLALTKSPIDFGVTEGRRELERQKMLVATGASQTLNSRHLANAKGLSEAVDLAAYLDTDGDGDKEFSWHTAHLISVIKAVQQAAIELGTRVRWGGCWACLNDVSSDLEAEVARYVSTWASKNPKSAAAGRGPFIDCPHIELV